MTGDPGRDARMIEWLEAGPSDVPVEPLEAAVAYARANPRRRLSWAGLRMAAMSHLHLTELTPRPAVRSWTAAFAAVAVVVLAAAAVIGGMGANGLGPARPLTSPIATGASTPAPSVAPTALPTPPIAITGTYTCGPTASGTTSTVGDVTQYRGLVLSCAVEMSDPRAVGKATVQTSIDERADGSADIWGMSTITNDDGLWTGPWSGTVDVGYTTYRIAVAYVGSGAYAGLRLRLGLVTGPGGYRATGSLERAETVPPDGATVVLRNVCSTALGGTTTPGDGIVRYRGIVLDCVGGSSDPRLDGRRRATVDIDERPDGSADMRGTFTITAADGAWTGAWTGTIDPGETTHRMAGVLTGSGAFEGLTLRFSQIGLNRDGYVMSGVIGPAG